MSDITNLFKATVKTVKSKNRVLGTGEKDKCNILSYSRQKGDFETKAKDVVKIMTKLRDYLLQHRKDYINAGSHLTSDTPSMSDSERDQIDTDCQKVIKSCHETIRQFRRDEANTKVSPQVRSHRDSVLFLIDAYLKYICKLYSEQRAVRVKRVVDRKRISRLEPDRKKMKSNSTDKTINTSENGKGDVSDDKGKSGVRPRVEKDLQERSSAGLAKSQMTAGMWNSSSGGKCQSIEEDRLQESDGEDFSPEEAQMFEQENKAIYEELNSMMNEVRQIEGKVVEISRLQEILSEKVLEQEKDVDRIADTVVGTTENITEGNEQIREALKKNAGFRVWILFFLVVCSLSLLFLDWYNA
ncbi:syntaxin-18-like [Liolophura sinensis]|uniref:syntaxin-18-like n=1 Tax=Liolophura sinensis TaxID=3198878 RepID=UPI003158F537